MIFSRFLGINIQKVRGPKSFTEEFLKQENAMESAA